MSLLSSVEVLMVRDLTYLSELIPLKKQKLQPTKWLSMTKSKLFFNLPTAGIAYQEFLAHASRILVWIHSSTVSIPSGFQVLFDILSFSRRESLQCCWSHGLSYSAAWNLLSQNDCQIPSQISDIEMHLQQKHSLQAGYFDQGTLNVVEYYDPSYNNHYMVL